MKNSNLMLEPNGQKILEPFEIKQALVALELGQTDEPILGYFNFLSQQVPISSAYFMHVVPFFEDQTAVFTDDSNTITGDFKLNEKIINELEKKVKKSIKKEKEIYVEYELKEGNPLEELLSSAENLKADLVIIGQSDQRKGHGILAKNLARKTKVNALIVPEQAKPSIRSILVPIDFSNNSIRSLQHAVRLKKQLKETVELVCLNIYSLPNMSYYKTDRPFAKFKKMIESNIRDAFDVFLSTYIPDDKNNVSIALFEKDLPGTARYIMEYAKANNNDLVVMGAKGHTKVELLLMGSVTESFLNLNDSIPTLIVK
jgi:nucleotide-binding universal stress UspA family protein